MWALKDLGIYGPVFPILEDNPILLLEARAKRMEQDGSLEKLNKLMEEKAERSINRPRPVEFLKKTTVPRVFFIDLTVLVDEEIKDAEGTVLFPKGMKVSPSSSLIAGYITRKKMLFFNGDDAAQVSWAIKQYSNQKGVVKLVLTNGSPVELANTFNIRTFFDQGGRYVRHFGIQQIPIF